MSIVILTGDAIDVLRGIESESIDCCITSPPYWGLRDYGVVGQIGLEPTLAEHLAVMVAVFEEVRRVLKPTGTCWINYGDCYATSPNGRSAADTKAAGDDDRTFSDKPFSTIQGSLKPKDLCMLPNRLAIALQDAGWWVRSEIVWGKPNAMPDSSGVYRPSVAHEKIFLLTKSGDGDVWRARDTGEISFSPDLSERRPLVTKPEADGPRWVRLGGYYDADAVRMSRSTADNVKQPDRHQGHISHTGLAELGRGEGRLLRNFEADVSEMVPPDVMAWEIAIAGFSGAHFATFPPALVVPCVMAGCPKGGTVLDPFGGAGTTGLVADRLQRDAVLIELNHEYAALARDRLRAGLAQVRCALPEDILPADLFDGVAA